ncbi:MAG TPA: cysteine desulfurase, partial [Verrucomicrobiales bacterium]|nr:cysteine desulfurase [Verrucomicrobiales bacterium]
LDRYYTHDNANVHRGLYELSARATEHYEAARRRVAAFFGAEENEIVFTKGTTEAINLVSHAWCQANLRTGDVILLTELEHHSNLVPWQLAAERHGASLRFVPVLGEDGALDEAAVPDLLTPEVKLFAFTHISNSLGTITPAAQWCALARSRGITTLVDGAQSAGHIPVNVKELGCDFYVFSGHKIGAPTGIGVLYGTTAALTAMPPFHGGGEMIESVRFERSTFRAPPGKFEAGTPPIAGAIGLAAALDSLDSLGMPNVAARDEHLTKILVDTLDSIDGVRAIGPKGPRGALSSFVMDGVHPHDLVTYCSEQGLAMRGGHHCTQPLMRKLKLPGTARASLYFYNTEEEIARAGEILTAARRFFA